MWKTQRLQTIALIIKAGEVSRKNRPITQTNEIFVSKFLFSQTQYCLFQVRWPVRVIWEGAYLARNFIRDKKGLGDDIHTIYYFISMLRAIIASIVMLKSDKELFISCFGTWWAAAFTFGVHTTRVTSSRSITGCISKGACCSDSDAEGSLWITVLSHYFLPHACYYFVRSFIKSLYWSCKIDKLIKIFLQ